MLLDYTIQSKTGFFYFNNILKLSTASQLSVVQNDAELPNDLFISLSEKKYVTHIPSP